MSRAGSWWRSAAVPGPRGGGAVGRTAGRGGHHQPHAARGLRARVARGSAGASCGCTRRTSAGSGSCEEVEIEELCGLGVPVIDDLGSGGSPRRSRRSPTSRGAASSRRRRVVVLRRQAARRATGRPDGGHAPRRSRRRERSARPRAASTSCRWPRSRPRCACTATLQRHDARSPCCDARGRRARAGSQGAAAVRSLTGTSARSFAASPRSAAARSRCSRPRARRSRSAAPRPRRAARALRETIRRSIGRIHDGACCWTLAP